MSSIWRRASSGCALGRSILLMTGMISRLFSTARYALASVCASTPCDASTMQQRALAGGERTGHLVREVDVARRVDQVQRVLLAVLRRVVQADRVRLDRDAALPLEIHRVEDLRLHLARLQRAGDLEEAIGKRRLAVVDVRDDREISDVLRVHYLASSGWYRCGYSGPMYSARGRISRLFAYCSSTCAVQPDTRLTAKIGVKRSTSIPSAW